MPIAVETILTSVCCAGWLGKLECKTLKVAVKLAPAVLACCALGGWRLAGTAVLFLSQWCPRWEACASVLVQGAGDAV